MPDPDNLDPLNLGSVQDTLLDNLLRNKGILSGKQLYMQFGESRENELKAAIRALESKNLVSIKGRNDRYERVGRPRRNVQIHVQVPVTRTVRDSSCRSGAFAY